MSRALAHVALLALTCPLVHGCTQVDGGAVEASWSIVALDVDEDQVLCSEAQIGEIELWMADDPAAPAGRRVDVFPCEDASGVTVFDLPEGDASLWLRPRCVDPDISADGKYTAPAPIVRTITSGDVITLDTQRIVVDYDARCRDLTPDDPACICRAE